jgi:mono/diheme cytochrome c family protein
MAGNGTDLKRRIMPIRHALLLTTLVFAIWTANAKARAIGEDLPSTYVPSGETLFRQYCATCHGTDATGHGPLAMFLKTPPADLTTLAERHGGKFPYDYVTKVLQFGPGPSSHGPSDMPAWGPVFRYNNKNDERAVQKRIKNLCDYLATLQHN